MRAGSDWFLLIVLLFLFSGLSSLIYQVVWTRQLVLLFGSTTLATSTILAVFMGGLALGSFLTGGICERIARPFLWYGLLEGAIGLWALLVPVLFFAAFPVYKLVWLQFHMSAETGTLLRFILAAGILIVPTTCMGATLPLLAKFMTTSLAYVGQRVGTLYAFNTLGAVLGAFLAGFVLLPSWGLQVTTWIASAINLALAVSVLVLSPGLEARVKQQPLDKEPIPALPYRTRLVMLIFGISGAIAMIYEVGWTRSLLMVIGSSTYAFTIMLCTFLSGIFLGSAICARFVDKARDAVAWFGLTQCYVCLAGLVSLSLFNHLPWWNLVLVSLLGVGWMLRIKLFLSALVLFPLTLGLGATFPIAVRVCSKDVSLVGRSVGAFYACNTVGAIVGALVTGFALIPLWGAERALIVACLANLLLGTQLFALSHTTRMPLKVGAVLCAILCAGLAVVMPLPFDKHLLLLAQPLRRSLKKTPLEERSFSQWRKMCDASWQVLYWKEGVCSTVGVVRWQGHNHTCLMTNGHVDASDGNDMSVQTLLSAFPLLFHPQAKRVAVVGWGSGVTIGSALKFPVSSVTVIELEPAVLEAARYFSHVNHQPERDPRIRVEINDGRNYLLTTNKKFDLLISEPSNPWQSGVCNLFTKEYFQICSQHLNPDGLFSCWLQTHEIPTRDVRGVIAAMKSAFPDCAALFVSENDLVLLASNKPIRYNVSTLNRLLQDKEVSRVLEAAGIYSLSDIFSRIEFDSRGFAAIAGGAQANDDDTNRLEYDVAKAYESGYWDSQTRNFLDANLGQPWNDIDWANKSPTARAKLLADVARTLLRANRTGIGLAWAQASLKLAPTAEACRLTGICCHVLGKPSEAERYWQQSLDLSPGNLDTLETRGVAHFQDGDLEGTRRDFGSVLSGHPENQVAKYSMAVSYLPLNAMALLFNVRPAQQENHRGDPALAARYVKDLILDSRFVSQHPAVLYIAAWVDYSQGKAKEGDALLRRYLATQPKSGHLLVEMIRSHH